MIYISSIVLFSIINITITQFFEKVWGPVGYLAKSSSAKSYWLSALIGNIHHIMMVIFAYYTFNNPTCKEDALPLEWYRDKLCMITVDKKFVYSNMITSGYMTYDYVI